MVLEVRKVVRDSVITEGGDNSASSILEIFYFLI